ncbi:MAG: flagellar basal-body MS-ring/collar protein FliF [Gammaproteobacteria bacterium]|nr:flagellar basal-body MS-ring/collar protein FliF [Gammaproteobacteria bacterium]MDH5593771.1 flagellar basal-body MS-ring/collar protein FliF [Gammaproteobacteria bacterium]MDH5613710.1 flagellar basal-body MS-ring/collar protein FliF [Gammaproteobacteria bacterium]
MAEVNPAQLAAPARGFNALPVLKQLGLMIGLAASVALGVAVVMWAQTPNYKMLYSNLSDKDTGLVMDALEKAKIEYSIDQSSGSVLVAGSKVHDARMLLAAQGLPKSAGGGFDSMDEQQGFGVSQFQEKARYHRAMEEELARTIMTLANVQTARVHLAVPKQSVFVRNRKKPSASVVLNLYAGRNLQPGQIEAIVNMVASSVSELDTNQVSVIDQKGRLLSKTMQDGDLSLSAGQFDYKRQLEEYYSRRVEDILTPIIGAGGVRAQVVADLDFTTTEQTQESYNPDLPAVRSEQVVEETSNGGMSSAGVPGALPNQPGTGGQGNAAEEGQSSSGSSSRRSVLNYELDRTISHTRKAAGSLRRISVAVVVDNKQVLDEAGEASRVKLTEDELARVISLVKDTIGFDAQRGDTVNVINAEFSQQPAPEPLPEPAIWEQAWVWDIAKQALGGAVILLLIFGVLKPVLGSLAKLDIGAGMVGGTGGEVMFPGAGGGDTHGGAAITQQAQERQRLNQSYEVNMNTAKQMVAQDPKRVAQVVKSWVGTGGEE